MPLVSQVFAYVLRPSADVFLVFLLPIRDEALGTRLYVLNASAGHLPVDKGASKVGCVMLGYQGLPVEDAIVENAKNLRVTPGQLADTVREPVKELAGVFGRYCLVWLQGLTNLYWEGLYEAVQGL